MTPTACLAAHNATVYTGPLDNYVYHCQDDCWPLRPEVHHDFEQAPRSRRSAVTEVRLGRRGCRRSQPARLVRLFLATGALAASIMACSGTPDGPPPVGEASVRDSAGIQIIVNPGSIPNGIERWALDTVSSLVIGGPDQAAEHDLTNMIYIARFRTGEYLAFLGDNRDPHFVVFDTHGKYLRRIGRRGSGPGEFPETVNPVFLDAHDSVWVHEPNLQRTTVFAKDGKFGRSINHSSVDGKPIMRLADGSLVFRPGPKRGGLPPTGDTVALDSVQFSRTDSDGTRFRPFLRVMSSERKNSDHLVFGRHYGAEFSDSLWYVVSGNGYEIQVFSQDAKLVRIIRRDVPIIPVTDAMRKRYREYLLEGVGDMPKNDRDALEERVAGTLFAKSVFPIGTIRLDRAGNLWVSDNRLVPDEPITQWTVFGPDGKLKATLTARGTEIEDAVDLSDVDIVSRRFDSDDVVQIVTRRITKSSRAIDRDSAGH